MDFFRRTLLVSFLLAGCGSEPRDFNGIDDDAVSIGDLGGAGDVLPPDDILDELSSFDTGSDSTIVNDIVDPPDVAPDVVVSPEDVELSDATTDSETSDVIDSGDASTDAQTDVDILDPPLLCFIDSPLSNDSFAIGTSITFTARVDQTGDETVEVSWSSDMDGELSADGVSSDGTSAFSFASLSAGTHAIRFAAVSDLNERSCEATVIITIRPDDNLPPTAAISSPEADAVFNVGDFVEFAGAVADDRTGLSALVIEWASDVDGVLDAAAPDETGQVGFSTSGLSPGAHLITLTVTDAAGLYAQVERAVYLNSPPAAPAVSVVPATPTTLDSLVAVLVTASSDPDGDVITYTYEWFVDEEPATLTTDTVEAAETTRGQIWTVVVTPADARSTGESATASVEIGNALPIVLASRISPETVTESTNLVCSAEAIDADEDALELVWAWSVNGTLIPANGPTLDGESFSRGDEIACIVTANDSDSSSLAVSSATVRVLDSPPVVDTLSLTPETPSRLSLLTCSASTVDADGDDVTLSYAWYINDDPAPFVTASVTAADFEPGDEVSCEATPTTSLASGDARRSNTVRIVNLPPGTSRVLLTPETLFETSTVNCEATSADPDGDAVTNEYTWFVDGLPIEGNRESIDGTVFSRGQSVGCVVRAWDGESFGTPVASETLLVRNTPPAVTVASVNPTAPDRTVSLRCEALVSDADLDSTTFSYYWLVNGIVTGTPGRVLPAGAFSRGDSIRCVVTPDDGTDQGSDYTSSAVVVVDTPPSVDTIELSPATPAKTSVLDCVATASDIDSEAVTLTYAWFINGARSTFVSPSISSTSFVAGDTAYCEVTPTASTATGETARSNTVTIIDSPPVTSRVELTPSQVFETTTVSCLPVSVDPEGDPLTHDITWYVDSVPFAMSSDSIDGTAFSRGQTIGCVARAWDGNSFGEAVASEVIVVKNSAPTVTFAAVSPPAPSRADTLQCEALVADADEELTSFTYSWLVNGVPTGPLNAPLANNYFVRGDSVRCVISPFDGMEQGNDFLSGSATIGNHVPDVRQVVIAPVPPTRGTPLRCEVDVVDLDGDTLTYDYDWTINDVPRAVEGNSLTTLLYARGSRVFCGVQVSDGTVTSPRVQSETVVIANTPIQLLRVFVSPNTVYEDSTIACRAIDLEPDGDTVTALFSWYVNDVELPVRTGSITGTWFSRGDSIYCRATVSDGFTVSETLESARVNVSNRPPQTNFVTITPSGPTELSTLTCNPSSFDRDGDPFSHAYTWFVNGVQVAPSTRTLDGTWFSRGNTVQCRVVPSDFEGQGVGANSALITIANTAPVVTRVTLTPSTATESTTLRCAGSATDVDGDTLSMSYRWLVNNVLTTVTANTLTGVHFSKGDAVVCRATATDFITASVTVNSATVIIGNTPPAAPLVTLSPSTPDGTRPLVCSASSTDIDGDTLTWSFTWARNGLPFTGTDTTLQPGDTVPSTNLTDGDTLVCFAVANDSSADSPTGAAAVTIVGP